METLAYCFVVITIFLTSSLLFRWNDRPGPDLQNSAVMQALVEEQNARVHGQTTGKIQSASGSKQGLSFKVLQWLTGTDSEDNSETASNCKSVCSLWRRIDD